MKRGSVTKFWQRFIDDLLPNAEMDVVERDGLEYAKILIPSKNSDFNAAEAVAGYVKNDKSQDGKPEVWSLISPVTVDDENGETQVDMEFTYDHMEKIDKEVYFFFLFEEAKEDTDGKAEIEMENAKTE
jgi:hypothetical protein